ncbi:MAG: ester cyclase [Thermoproteota archaeon]|nr:ester cyclase [Thermoproteota archaeon]
MLTGPDQKTGFVTFLFLSTILIASFTLAPYSGFASLQTNNTSIEPEALQDMATSTTPSSSNQSEIVVAQTPEEQANLDHFDRLDFEAWNNRNWTLFEELHSPDVLVVDFNGNTTRGIDQHLQWAMAAVSAQPESRVLAHPIKVAAGDWTVGTGTLPGNLTMVTIAHWEDGRIAEEYLFLQGPPAPMMMMNQTEAGQ